MAVIAPLLRHPVSDTVRLWYGEIPSADWLDSLYCMAKTAKALLVALLVMTSPGSPAPTVSNDEPECSKQGAGKLQLTEADTTILGLKIGSASLKDVQAKLGSTDSLPTHGNASASNTICYVSPADGTVLTFGASGMGGFVDVTEFAIWSGEAKFPNVLACRPSELVSRSLSTKSRIRLGLSVQQLSDIIGARPKTGPPLVRYELICRQKMTEDEIKGFKTANNWDVSEDPYFDVSSFVEARFTSSGASRTEVTKIESYRLQAAVGQPVLLRLLRASGVRFSDS